MKKKYIFLVVIIAGIFLLATGATVRGTRKTPILLYHHIVPDQEGVTDNPYIVTQGQFANQMAYLKENGYTTITQDQMYRFLYNKETLPEKSVMITFDDGYLSNYIYAYDILKDYGFRASIFMITGFMPETIDRNKMNEYPFISFDMLDETRDVFEYGSHTDQMHYMTEDEKGFLLSKSYGEVYADLQESISKLGGANFFAYPYGDFKRETVAILKQLDIKMAYSIQPGYVTRFSAPHKLRRFTITPETTMEQFVKIVQ